MCCGTLIEVFHPYQRSSVRALGMDKIATPEWALYSAPSKFNRGSNMVSEQRIKKKTVHQPFGG